RPRPDRPAQPDPREFRELDSRAAAPDRRRARPRRARRGESPQLPRLREVDRPHRLPRVPRSRPLDHRPGRLAGSGDPHRELAGRPGPRSGCERVRAEGCVNRHPIVTEIGRDRLVSFSDAVFAFAITLLALDVRVPELASGATNADLGAALMALAPKLFA